MFLVPVVVQLLQEFLIFLFIIVRVHFVDQAYCRFSDLKKTSFKYLRLKLYFAFKDYWTQLIILITFSVHFFGFDLITGNFCYSTIRIFNPHFMFIFKFINRNKQHCRTNYRTKIIFNSE
jgi:hypothetical protein